MQLYCQPSLCQAVEMHSAAELAVVLLAVSVTLETLN